MKKEIKDYLHLYFGCEVKHMSFNSHFKLVGVLRDRVYISEKDSSENAWGTLYENIKPILRPLSSLSEDEWLDIEYKILIPDACGFDALRDNFIIGTDEYKFGWEGVNDALIELRKRGVDVDGLIESGLAIDKSTLK